MEADSIDQLDLFAAGRSTEQAMAPQSVPAPRKVPEALQTKPDDRTAPPPLRTNGAANRSSVSSGTVTVKGQLLIVRFPYDPLKVSYVKMISRAHGARKAWKPETKEWQLPLKAASDLAHMDGMTFSEEFKALLEKASESKADLNSYMELIVNHPFDVTAELPDGKTLREHQREGVMWMLSTLRLILADEMGLGKTLQALVAAKVIHEATKISTVIITKAALISDWQEQARAIKHRSFTVHSWGSIPEPPAGHKIVLICDEGHLAQSMTAQRTKRMIALADQSFAIFILTGTPMKNGKPINLFALLRAIGHPLGSNKTFYEKRYCKAYLKKFKKKDTGKEVKFWDAGGADNLEELRQHLKTIMLRRLKAECLDLPAKTRVLRPVDVTPEMQEQYDTTVEACKRRFQERVEANEVKKEGEALAILTYIRMAASIAKVPAAIELAQDIIEEGGTPVIFAEFKETAKAIAKALGVPSYDGDQKNRPQIVKDFQARKLPAFVGTRESGGTGLTLTAGNSVILVDRPMTPGDCDQAEDRLHRIGQSWPVTAYWLRAFKVCRTIDSLLDKKMAVIKRVVDGQEDKVRGSGSLTSMEVLQAVFWSDRAG